MTMGGVSCRGGLGLLGTGWVAVALRDDQADIIARRRQEYDRLVAVLGIQWGRWMRARDEAIVVVVSSMVSRAVPDPANPHRSV
jgi:hypothetical protein